MDPVVVFWQSSGPLNNMEEGDLGLAEKERMP